MTVSAVPVIARLTAPVSRLLAVADLARSVAFYRERLGFALVGAATHLATDAATDREAQLARGPARVILQEGDAAWDSTLTRTARGDAIVYFPVDDVHAMRAELLSRGASVSAVCAVNVLKLHVCTLIDPDGHALWFGTSYHHETPAPPPPIVTKIMPSFPCHDVPASVTYYRETLGFSVNYAQDAIGVMDRDHARILLVTRTPEMTGVSACYLYVRDADLLHAQLTERGARVEGEPVSQPWGLREFHVRDPDGNRLTFGEPFE